MAVTSPKFFLAVKLQTVCAITSKQSVKVRRWRRKEHLLNFICSHALPTPPNPARRMQSCDSRCALRHFRCLRGGRR